MRDLTGLNVVLTGASRGIGPHIAEALAREQTNLVLASRSQDELDAVAGRLSGLGIKAAAVPTDVSDRSSIESLVEQSSKLLGSIDVLVNNAGIEMTSSYDELQPDEIARVIEVNLIAPMLLTRLVLPGMLERGRGHIVNVASLAGKAGIPYQAPYSASKGGLIRFTQSLRAEYAGRGVSASVICPGFVDSGMYQRANDMGVKAPAMTGVSKVEKVAKAVVDAIRHDRVEAIVNPTPMRPLLAAAELFPSLSEGIVRRMGVNDMFKEWADRAAEK